jgi:nucleoside-diphosphate-sugar epimerase
VQSGPLVLGDLLDRERLDEALALYAPDAVVHLAATRDEAPDRRYANDVGGSLSLLEAMQSRGVSSIVFASSTDAGGEGAPADAAATAKRIVEQMLEDAGHAYGIRSVVLRLPRLVDQTVEDGLPVLDAADAVVEAIDHLAGGGASVVRALGQGPAPERNRSVA